jgi:hypothetical protein
VLVLELGTHLDDENEHDDEHDWVAAVPPYAITDIYYTGIITGRSSQATPMLRRMWLVLSPPGLHFPRSAVARKQA